MSTRVSNDLLAEFSRSEQFHNSFLIPKDQALEDALKYSKEQGLPDIAVSAAQGKLLKLLAQSIGAKRILEVGTLGGYSTIWLSRALPQDGEVITLELSERHAQVARENLARAGVEKTRVVVGNAAETIAALGPDGSFDLVFIDADKQSSLKYFVEAKRLTRKHGVIITDNVVRDGDVADPQNTDPKNIGVRELLAALKDDTEVEAASVATVGEKGYDGFLYAIKL
ncbi:O-methyltransferase-domain-containing protein [Phlebopus sp. FC_14]|nr:O-methyltransferase-domain-containing protein [Phlebopus sp. FC_14]